MLVELPSVHVNDATEYLVEDEVYGFDTWWSAFLPGFALVSSGRSAAIGGHRC